MRRGGGEALVLGGGEVLEKDHVHGAQLRAVPRDPFEQLVDLHVPRLVRVLDEHADLAQVRLRSLASRESSRRFPETQEKTRKNLIGSRTRSGGEESSLSRTSVSYRVAPYPHRIHIVSASYRIVSRGIVSYRVVSLLLSLSLSLSYRTMPVSYRIRIVPVSSHEPLCCIVSSHTVSYRIRIVSCPCPHVSTSPRLHVSTSPRHPDTTSPRLHVPTSSRLHFPASPRLHVPASPRLHVSPSPRLHVPTSPRLHIFTSPCLHVSQ